MSPTIRSAKLPRWHLTWNFQRTLDSSAREAADKYTKNAGNYLMDATGFSLRTEIYYLSQMRITNNMQATFDIHGTSGAHLTRVPEKLQTNTPRMPPTI